MSNGHPWLPEHSDTLRRMNAVGYFDCEIAAITGHKPITVFYRRKSMGLPASKRRRTYRLHGKYKNGASSSAG